MIRFSLTLHLGNTGTSYAQSSNQSSSLYSLTRNSLSSPMARSAGRIMSHKTHTKKGEPTLYGLLKGYIQASPYYPETTLAISLEGESIVVQGKTKTGQYLDRKFKKLKDARRFLKETI